MKRDDAETVLTLGIPLHTVTMAEALDRIDGFVAHRRPRYLVTANVHFAAAARDDVELQRILCEADLVLCDGTPLLWASRLLGAHMEERVAGSDLLHPLLERAAQKGHRVFFLGGTREGLEEARRRAEERNPGVCIAGLYSPPYGDLLSLDVAAIASEIRAAEPDILLVAMGCPKQEKLISMTYRELGVPCSIGVGATLDFLAGRFRRAPAWMKRTGTEWLFRLAQEPRRLFSRYAEDFGFFFPGLAAELWRNGSRRPATPAVAPPQLPGATFHRWSGRDDALPAAAGAGAALLLGLEGVSSLDAVALGTLVHAWRTYREAGVELVLYRPALAAARALAASRLDRVLRIAHTEEEARRILAAPAGGVAIAWNFAGGALRGALRGELSTAAADACRRELGEAWRAHPEATAMELDLAELFALGTAGLAVFRDLAAAVQARNGARFTLRGASHNVLNVIEHGGGRALEVAISLVKSRNYRARRAASD